MGISKGFGLIDIFFTILCFIISYSAIRRGFLIEIFKVIGLFLSLILAFQFYPFLSGSLEKNLTFLHKQYFNCAAFIGIFFSVSIAFYLLEKLLGVFLKAEELSAQERFMSLILGGARFILLASVVFFILSLSPQKINLAESFFYRTCKPIAPKVYLVAWKAYNKFNPNTIVLNKEVQTYYETKDDLPRNSKKRT